MTMYGADIAALRGLAGALRRTQHDIDATRRHLTAAVERLPWAGRDHDRFADEWRRVHDPALTTVAIELSNASRLALVHADRQEHASRPDR
jgi:uncharacterized protein YukE